MAQVPEAVALQENLAAKRVPLGSGPMFEHHLDHQRLSLDPENPEDRLAAKPEKAMQGNIPVVRIPQKVGRRKLLDLCECTQDLAQETLAVLALQTGRRKSTQLLIKECEHRILPRLRNLHQKPLLVNLHRGLQLLTA